jgi:Lrp/AsnC family transcriptional regulator, leucine-responsive regulatory protein
MTLTAKDRKILACLQSDGRMSNVALAERVGISPSPCLVPQVADASIVDRFKAAVRREPAIVSCFVIAGQVEGHIRPPRAQIVVGARIESEQHAGAFDRRVERVIRAIESKAATDVGVPHPSRRKPVGPGRHGDAVVGPLTPG